MFEEAEYSFPVAEDTSVDDAVGMGPRPRFHGGRISTRGQRGRGVLGLGVEDVLGEDSAA